MIKITNNIIFTSTTIFLSFCLNLMVNYEVIKVINKITWNVKSYLYDIMYMIHSLYL